MKIEIYKPKEEHEKKEEPIRLKFVERFHGIMIVAMDKDGAIVPGGELMFFLEDGTIRRKINILPDLGFQLDEKGRIKIED